MEAETDQTSVFDRIEVTSDFTDDEWRVYTESASDAVPAHLIEWRDLIRDTFGYEPIYRMVKRNGVTCGILPAFEVRSLILGRHIISVPFLNSGGICADDEAAFHALLSEAQDIVSERRARHYEMRCLYPPPNGIPAREHKVRIVLNLPDNADDLWSSFRSEIRNRTKHAQTAGLHVEFNSRRIGEFYSVFAGNMRDIGVPVHPRRFFETVLSAFPERSELAVVVDADEVIGGAILFGFRKTIEVPWISCSRAHFKNCPNNILYWEMMRRACEQGYRIFDFGRSSPDTGPATFKLRWGARTSQLYWQYVLGEGADLPGETGSSNPRYKLASSIWSKLPSRFTNVIGPKIISHLPG